jgi:hypothetical protein
VSAYIDDQFKRLQEDLAKVSFERDTFKNEAVIKTILLEAKYECDRLRPRTCDCGLWISTFTSQMEDLRKQVKALQEQVNPLPPVETQARLEYAQRGVDRRGPYAPQSIEERLAPVMISEEDAEKLRRTMTAKVQAAFPVVIEEGEEDK